MVPFSLYIHIFTHEIKIGASLLVQHNTKGSGIHKESEFLYNWTSEMENDIVNIVYLRCTGLFHAMIIIHVRIHIGYTTLHGACSTLTDSLLDH